jgi:leucyl aminopeptidase (aminopeptidase T)
MCVSKGESVVLTADTATDLSAVEAIVRAVVEAQAKIAVIVLPQLPYQGALANDFVPASVEAAVKNCDVWIDITFPYLAGSRAHDEAMKPKKLRYMLAAALRAEGLSAIYGKGNLDLFGEIQVELDKVFTAALGKECRITTPAGTDVTFTLGKPGYAKRRKANEAGLYTPPASALMFPEPKSVRGEIVLETIFHEYYTRLTEHARIRLDGGITEVSGAGTERKALDRALRRACSGGYGSIIHLTYAYNPAVPYAGEVFLEDARALGNNAVGLGLPWWLPGGGENHPDGIMSMQSIWIDGQQIVKNGVLSGHAKLAELGAKLEPVLA